jgi:hypothetical protein
MPRFVVKRIDNCANHNELYYVKYNPGEYVNMGPAPVIYEQPCFFDVLAYLWSSSTVNNSHPGLHHMLHFFSSHPQNSPTQRVWTWGTHPESEQILVIRQ